MRTRFFAIFIFISAILHFVWESFHIRFYGGYDALSPYLPLSLWATIADIFYAIAALLFVSLIKHWFGWLGAPRWNDILGLALIGFSIALFVEYKAFIFGKWYYLDTMPIIPFLEVGLSPILQMTILLPFATYLAGKISHTPTPISS